MKGGAGDEFIERCLKQVMTQSRIIHHSMINETSFDDLISAGDQQTSSSILEIPSSIFNVPFISIKHLTIPFEDNWMNENLKSEKFCGHAVEHQLFEVLSRWSDKYFQKVVLLVRRDSNEFSEFLKRFLKVLSDHQQLNLSGFFYPLWDNSLNSKYFGMKPGWFLIRNSSDPNCLFTMSFKATYGVVKSTRIVYEKGEYYFDCSSEHAKTARKFQTPLHLIQHYSNSQNQGSPSTHQNSMKKRSSVTGGMFDYEECVVLRRPLKIQPDSLSHRSRLTINRLLRGRSMESLHINRSLKEYLQQYTFTF